MDLGSGSMMLLCKYYFYLLKIDTSWFSVSHTLAIVFGFLWSTQLCFLYRLFV